MSHYYEGRNRRRDAESHSLHVRGYDIDKTTEDDMRALFEKYGSVADVYMPRHFQSQQVRGFSYVQFHHADDAENARLELDRTDAFNDGLTLNVMWAQGRRKTPEDMQRMDRIRAMGGHPNARGPEYYDRRGGRYSPSRGGRYSPSRGGRGGRFGGRGFFRGRGGYSRYGGPPMRRYDRDRTLEYGRYSRKRSRSRSESPYRGRSHSPPVREHRKRRYDSPPPKDYHRSPSPGRDRVALSPVRTGRYSSPPKVGRHSPAPRDDRHSPIPDDGRYSPPPKDHRHLSPPRDARYSPLPKGNRYSPTPDDNRYASPPEEGRYSPPPRNGRYSPPHRERSPTPRRSSISPPREGGESPGGVNGYGNVNSPPRGPRD